MVKRDSSIKSPTTYGKEAYETYRRKEKIKEVSRRLHGQKRTKEVMEVNYTTALAILLKNAEFPAHKDRIVEFLLKARSLPRTQVNETLSLVQQIEEKKYKNVAEVIRAMDLVKDIPNK